MNLKQQLIDLGAEVDAEIDEAMNDIMTKQDKVLHKIAQNLLLLERDLNVPGGKKSQEDRVDRLIDAITKEDF